jgi:hypothetical protein
MPAAFFGGEYGLLFLFLISIYNSLPRIMLNKKVLSFFRRVKGKYYLLSSLENAKN